MIEHVPAVSDTQPPEDAIKATDAALSHFKRKLSQSDEAKGICFAVKKAGCSGFKYDITYVATQPEASFVFAIASDLPIYVPHDSFPFVSGCTLDYVKDGINSTLRVLNPNETGACGCGESFSI